MDDGEVSEQIIEIDENVKSTGIYGLTVRRSMATASFLCSS